MIWIGGHLLTLASLSCPGIRIRHVLRHCYLLDECYPAPCNKYGTKSPEPHVCNGPWVHLAAVDFVKGERLLLEELTKSGSAPNDVTTVQRCHGNSSGPRNCRKRPSSARPHSAGVRYLACRLRKHGSVLLLIIHSEPVRLGLICGFVRDWRADAQPLLRLTTNTVLPQTGTLRFDVDGTTIESLPIEQLREIQAGVTSPAGFRPLGGEGFWYPTGCSHIHTAYGSANRARTDRTHAQRRQRGKQYPFPFLCRD